MTIEVIKRGDLPEDQELEATCPRCRSELRFKRSDGRFSTDERDGNAVVIECPVCNGQVWKRP